MTTEGTTLYCGDNCNHTGPHRYRPRVQVILPTGPIRGDIVWPGPLWPLFYDAFRWFTTDPSLADPTDPETHGEGEA